MFPNPELLVINRDFKIKTGASITTKKKNNTKAGSSIFILKGFTIPSENE